MNKCYSSNEEDFTDYESAVESALENFLLDNPTFEGETELEIFEGDQESHTISDFIPPFLAQDIAERAYEKAGEWGGEWGDSLKEREIQEIVSAALENWANQTNNQPYFYSLENVKPIMVKIRVDKSGNWEDIS